MLIHSWGLECLLSTPRPLGQALQPLTPGLVEEANSQCIVLWVSMRRRRSPSPKLWDTRAVTDGGDLVRLNHTFPIWRTAVVLRSASVPP